MAIVSIAIVSRQAPAARAVRGWRPSRPTTARRDVGPAAAPQARRALGGVGVRAGVGVGVGVRVRVRVRARVRRRDGAGGHLYPPTHRSIHLASWRPPQPRLTYYGYTLLLTMAILYYGTGAAPPHH
eukprot:scaffold41103_cov32-Phaeocystis_antarctica.AAC.1